ncbi:host cell factor 2 isoform X3 [Benincasa hispida]|uniref:host cell factor 2 isoform X3 n=1 Tax=Benincasa hispida TaxID=102211 RepID=UPI0019020FC5|nr:host cell factor 2 isoform X3 [Benincasa hispida]
MYENSIASQLKIPLNHIPDETHSCIYFPFDFIFPDKRNFPSHSLCLLVHYFCFLWFLGFLVVVVLLPFSLFLLISRHKNMRWERVQLLSRQGQDGALGEIAGPGKRWGHTCNAIKDGRYLYVFGGYGKDNCQTNQVHVFDTDWWFAAKQTWSRPVIKGSPPTPRDSHTCITIGDNLFVFGGTDGMSPLKDLHILDTSLHTWICPSLRGEGPEAREGHSATLVGKRLFIFGGCGKSISNNDEVYYNDLYILNTETFVWKQATTSGTPPSPRDSHTCSSWKNKVIVIGGEDAHDYYLSDVHILDTDTLVWTELNTSGQLLPPRAGHTTIAFGKSLFVFGGFTDAQNLYSDLHMLDIETGVWTKITTMGDGPSARFSVAGDCLDPYKVGTLALLGGCNKGLEALDDMYYLFTGLAKENERKPEKLSLRKQLKLKCQEQNLNASHGRAMVQIGISDDVIQPIAVQGYGAPHKQNFPLNQSQHLQGKKSFQARVTESIPSGYTIETVIDGKPLRGILFSNRPIPTHFAHHSTVRKRTFGDIGRVSNGDINIKSKTSRPIKKDEVDNRQEDGSNIKATTMHEAEMVVPSTMLTKDPVSSDALLPSKVSSSPELPPSSLKDISMHVPMDIEVEISGNTKTNDTLDSTVDIQKESIPAPDSNKETIAFFPDQDDRRPATIGEAIQVSK